MRRICIAILLPVLALMAACSGGGGDPAPSTSTSASSAPTSGPTSSASTTASCTLSDRLVPSCGVIWGVSTKPATMDGVAKVESLVGRPFDMIYRYHDIKEPIPDDVDRQAVAAGRILHLSIAARIYTSDTTVVTYKDIAAGKYDATLRAQGKGIAGLKVPVFVTFEQEANQHKKLDVRGDATQFKAAWRHVRSVYLAAGASNAVWTWVMTGAPENLDRAGMLWPGNDQVDWISWNVYNASGCNSGKVKPANYKSVKEALSPFYDWVHAKGPKLGIDPNKPMMISESGSVLYTADPGLTAAWYTQIPGVLKEYPQIKAFTLWASETSLACNYQFQDVPAISAAVAKSVTDAPLTERIAPFKAAG